MRNSCYFDIDDSSNFAKKLLLWSRKFNYKCMLESNISSIRVPVSYNQYDFIFAVDSIACCSVSENSFSELQVFYDEHKDWMFGYLSYDLKNQIEDLTSSNINLFNNEELCFFIPKYLFLFKDNKLCVKTYQPKVNIHRLIKNISSIHVPYTQSINIKLKPRENKSVYLKKIENIKKHIQKGDIYELNYCQEFFNEDVAIIPEEVFFDLNESSKAPFASFLQIQDFYVIGSSPERFLLKKGSRLLSQPIKGTSQRGKDRLEDESHINHLKTSHKDIAENIMITDLVRNDLSKTAKKGTVSVEELCEVYSFEGVHQMITSISSKCQSEFLVTEILESCFPMGSMTGAPKIEAMKLIDKYENVKRGVFSGAIGYISPTQDFDFNVVIRSLLYDSTQKYLSLSVGGAITINSDPLDEYEECLTKAKNIFRLLNKEYAK